MTTDIWPTALDDLKLQMTQATFNTWLANTTGQVHGDTLTIKVSNGFARDWLENRLAPTITRTVARVAGRPLQITYNVRPQATDERPDPGSGSGPLLPESRAGLDERDIPPNCRVGIEIVNFNPTNRGWVRTPNYALQFWQPYLAVKERQTGSRRGGIAFPLWLTLRSFPASWSSRSNPLWPSIQTIADTCSNRNRHAILGRASYGQGKNRRERTIGALELLETERIVWPKRYGQGRNTIYVFRVLEILPLLMPAQIALLTPRLQERHMRELAKCQLDYEEWQQLTLFSLTTEEGP